MPLVAHNSLPAYDRLSEEGQVILRPGQAVQQDIRALHIGLLNMMPDAALQATERQFFRLVGESNQIVQFYMHTFTLPNIKRDKGTQEHIDTYYEDFESIKKLGLDALIITGANVTQPDLSKETFWKPLTEVFEWSHENVASTLCSCLATHAALEYKHQQKRRLLRNKVWGVFKHQINKPNHPLVSGINTQFDVPHSRFNQVDEIQFTKSKLDVLVSSKDAGTHLAVSEDGIRTVFFQGHPEYDNISLVKEYIREVNRYISDELSEYPPYPENIFDSQATAIVEEYAYLVKRALTKKETIPEFPEQLIISHVHNSWHDTASAILGNWMGLVYKLTNLDRTKLFKDGISADNPLNR